MRVQGRGEAPLDFTVASPAGGGRRAGSRAIGGLLVFRLDLWLELEPLRREQQHAGENREAAHLPSEGVIEGTLEPGGNRVAIKGASRGRRARGGSAP